MAVHDHLVPINNICQQKCNFCSAEYRMIGNKPIPLKHVFNDILLKWNYIQVSGWEPLLHPKVFEILYFIRKYKPKCFIEFQSNGLLLLKNDNLTKLMKFQINLFNINYPSHLEEINDAVVRIPKTLKIREAGMHEIIKRWWKLRINIIVNKVNYPYIAQTVDYIYENFKGLERIQFSFTKAMGAANKNEEVVPRYEEAEPFYIAALDKCEQYGIKVDVDHIPMCFLGKHHLRHVDYHKKKSGERGVFEIEKNYVERCTSCDKRDLCTGYRKDYLQIYPEWALKI